MLCSKCHQKIPQGEEIQIEGSIICQKCVLDSLEKKEAISRCNGCFELIYKDEIIHEVYENGGAENSEKLIKCQSCYEKGLEISKLKRNYGWGANWIDKTSQFSMGLALVMVTISVDKLSGGHFFASRVNWLLITYHILLNPLLFSFILFIYQKLRKRTITKQKIAKISEEVKKLNGQFYSKM